MSKFKCFLMRGLVMKLLLLLLKVRQKIPQLETSLLEDCAPGTCVPEFHSFFWSAGGFSILCKRICKGTGAQDKVSIPFALRHFGHLVNVTHVQKAICNPGGLVVRILYSAHHVHYVHVFVPMKLFRENAT